MLLGVGFSLLASICFSLSNLVEKRAIDKMTHISTRRSGQMIQQLVSSWVWISGFLAGAVAIGLMILGYMYAPIAVVQTIFGAGLVLVILVSRWHLREPMTRREHLGFYVVIVAIVLISITLGTGNKPGIGGGPVQVLTISGATFLAAMCLFGVLHRYPFADVSLRFGATSGLLYGIAGIQSKSIAVLFENHGIVRGISASLESPYPYLFATASILGLLVFQSGLQQCRFVVVVPVTNVVASVYVVVIGMFVFGETFPHNAALTALRLTGFALVLTGNWIFVVGPTHSPKINIG